MNDTITLIQSNHWQASTTQHYLSKLKDTVRVPGCQWFHIGSTSIPNILCKPILDLLLAVPEPDGLEQLDQQSQAFQKLGFEIMGEFGIAGRRYFRKLDHNGERLVHLHAFLTHSEGMLRHLAFRDYLREFPTIAAEYSHLKRQLHDTFQGDREAYMDGKHDFIQRTEKDALQWLTERSKNNTQVTDFTEL